MRRTLALLACAIALAGCGKKKARVTPAVPRPVGSVETGLASWYGHPYHGRAAANGEIYDMEKLTAAHRTLPFGTWVRVRNLQNDKAVDLRIIDRGPFVEGRIIDVSHAAARQIGLIGPGVAKVRMEVISAPREAAEARYAVQVGAFRDRRNAERLRKDMEKRYGAARMVLREGNPAIWRVLVGDAPSESAAEELAARVRNGSRSQPAFVVRVDL